MLSIKHHLSFSTPRLKLANTSVRFGAIPSENDELIQAIDNSDSAHDDNWQLTKYPDTDGLESYWTGVEHDLQNDPEWFEFADD